MPTAASRSVLVHISGPDKAGVTAGLCKALAEHDAQLLDIGQNVLHGYLILSALIKIPQGSDALHGLLECVSNLGLRLELGDIPEQKQAPHENLSHVAGSLCITLLGDLSNTEALSECTHYLAQNKVNIREIKALSSTGLHGIEILGDISGVEPLSQEEFQRLRGDLYALSSKLKIDIAAQRENVFRRNKRLICMDVDSTFVPGECIDILGQLNNCGEEIARITAKAMAGELNFEAALRERVKKLAGLSLDKSIQRLQGLAPHKETQDFVRSLRALGLKVGVVSGGFDFYVNSLKEQFHLDFAFANKLQVKDGVFTGELEGEIITPQKKAELLSHMSHAYECPMNQCVAVGDGANDIPMLQSAGLGIAFQAKRSVQEKADTRLNCSNLDSILYLMGYKEKELQELS